VRQQGIKEAVPARVYSLLDVPVLPFTNGRKIHIFGANTQIIPAITISQQN